MTQERVHIIEQYNNESHNESIYLIQLVSNNPADLTRKYAIVIMSNQEDINTRWSSNVVDTSSSLIPMAIKYTDVVSSYSDTNNELPDVMADVDGILSKQ